MFMSKALSAKSTMIVFEGAKHRGTGSSAGGDHARTEEREGGRPSHVDRRTQREEVEAAEEGFAKRGRRRDTKRGARRSAARGEARRSGGDQRRSGDLRGECGNDGGGAPVVSAEEK
ncbi:hypothetical protein Scep_014241 [Stephania cephalantha]|uniref:Uncharacterized protein n=1 Tax=Stephania cephalantha TaxID=152367 RepID=A0AAP0P1G7_9MAGN